MSIVSDTVNLHLPPKRKSTPSGWIKFNAVCCQHNGHSADTRARGGMISNPDGGVSYHCFNCGFKTSWQPGRNLSRGLRRLMQWLNVSDDLINRVALEVMRENEGFAVNTKLITVPVFNTVPLPTDAVPIANCEAEGYAHSPHLQQVLQYMHSRNLYLEDYEFWWSPSLGYRDRLIVPFGYQGRTVGWTARKVTDGKPKYLSEQQPGYVFNLDAQLNHSDSIYTVVVEGPIDAIHINGVALMGSEIKDQQALLINQLGRHTVLVPDRDPAGSKLIEPAIALGWSVSMPEWPDGINDVGDAVQQHGRLYALYMIMAAVTESPLKTRLRAKQWFINT